MSANATTEQNVFDAVTTSKRATKDGILQRIFALWFDAFVYNQIWEDPRVDLQALKLDENSRVLSISSGGCNVLNYLLETPASVTAVDLNRYHIYLLRLKVAAVKFLPSYKDFFRFFGDGKHVENVEMYRRHIAPKLDDDTRRFWESNGIFGQLIYGERINYFAKSGLYEHSRNGYFLRFFHKFAELSGHEPEKLLTAKTLDEQERLFKSQIEPFFDSWFIKIAGKMPVTMFGLGIPPQQSDELKKELSAGASIVGIYRERAKKLACSFDIKDNYFAWQAFARKYDTVNRCAVPEYLKEDNFDRLVENAPKVRTAVGSITDKIMKMPVGTFNRFVFLDAQDWMDAKALTALWSEIADKAERRSRIIFRTAGSASPLESTLPVELMKRFSPQNEESARLFEQDRSSIYGGYHLYVVN